ncbi:hypothetical protein BU17DRAFT_64114 [Hysterangium stoloniferum]|nr:hypothetical protein BU17DRAFT_64114 [Hysterangium stoloniferum]
MDIIWCIGHTKIHVTSRPHSTQHYYANAPGHFIIQIQIFSVQWRSDGHTGNIGLATAPAATRSDNSDNDSSHTALPSLPKLPRRMQSHHDAITKRAKKENYGSNYGERDSSISGLSEGKEEPSKALSNIKLHSKTHQDNKQPSTIRDDAQTHTLKPNFSVHLGHHKDAVKYSHISKKDAILGGDAKDIPR